MKTYEEALGLILRVHPDTESQDDHAASMAVGLEKRTGLCEEIHSHEPTRMMIHAMVHAMVPDDADIGCDLLVRLCLSAFMNGVMVGAEMERQELPEPRFPEEG